MAFPPQKGQKINSLMIDSGSFTVGTWGGIIGITVSITGKESTLGGVIVVSFTTSLVIVCSGTFSTLIGVSSSSSSDPDPMLEIMSSGRRIKRNGINRNPPVNKKNPKKISSNHPNPPDCRCSTMVAWIQILLQ